MSDDTETTLETPGLDRLVRALKQDSPKIRVGVLGAKAGRGDPSADKASGLNNAEVGAFHEFGNGDMQRSFLRVPISDHLQKEMESSGALDEDVLQEVIKTGDLIGWAKKVAALCEGIVAKAFDSQGYGKWKPSQMKYKEVKQTLVETQQLRNSITSEVK